MASRLPDICYPIPRDICNTYTNIVHISLTMYLWITAICNNCYPGVFYSRHLLSMILLPVLFTMYLRTFTISGNILSAIRDILLHSSFDRTFLICYYLRHLLSEYYYPDIYYLPSHLLSSTFAIHYKICNFANVQKLAFT